MTASEVKVFEFIKRIIFMELIEFEARVRAILLFSGIC
jgi:hypothetical protein